MNSPIKTEVTIVVPPILASKLDHLVTDYALATKEEPSICRRLLEITIIQRGMASVREGLKK